MKLFVKLGVFLFIFSSQAFSQSVKVKGVVKDSVGAGLEMANVIAFDKVSNTMENYAITDSKGNYFMSLPSGKRYEFKVSYMGFDTETVLVDLNGVTKEFQQDVLLKESGDLLDEVEIAYEMPVTIKGDTIVYNSDSFRNGTEKKLEDVLEKLPGVEVNDDGQVEVEGKLVSKVMVEGKDFFDGDSKVAVQNIPADALDKIEVLRNYNEVGQMKGVTNNEDNIAINIRLKKGKEKFWFGEVTAGAGLDERYLVHPKIFYYSPKTSVNLLTDFNNIGKVPFTTRDYYRFTGGFRNLSSRGGTSLNIGNNTVGLSTTQNNKAHEITSKFGASNFSYNPNSKTTFSGFGIYSGNETELLEDQNKSYEDSGDVERTRTATRQQSHLALLKLSAKYKPTTDFQLDYDVFFKKSEQGENALRTSELNGADNGYIFSDINDDPFSFTQNLNLYKTLDSKNILAFEAQYLYQKEVPLFQSISDVLNVSSFLTPPLNSEQDLYNLTQDKIIKTGRLDAKFNYYYILNAKSHLNLTVGTLLSTQDFNTGIFQTLDDERINDFTDAGYNNDVRFGFSDVFTALHYKFVHNKLTLEPGVKLHYYHTKDTQLDSENTNGITRLLPDFYANYQFKKTQNLRFRYEMSNQFADVQQLSEGLIFNNYNAVFFGNRDLESAVFHRYSLNFFSFVMYNYTNVNAGITYTKKENMVKRTTSFDGIGQSASSINSIIPDETVNANLRYGRTFRKFKVNLKGSGNYSKNYNIRNNQWVENIVYTYSYGGNVGTNFNKAPNITLGYSRNINDYGDRIYYTDRPYVDLDALFLKYFTLKAEYDYYNYRDEAGTITNKYAFLEASLSFRIPDNPWEFIVSGTNLLDTQSLNRDNISIANNIVTTSIYYVQPRYLMFVLKYNL